MRKFIVVFSFFIPVLLFAQKNIILIDDIKMALKDARYAQATIMFSQLIDKDIEQSERLYWESKFYIGEVSSDLAYRLAVKYESNMVYNKAFFYYKEALYAKPNRVDCMLPMANIYLRYGEEDKAVKLCEKIAEKDENNTEANIILGNYFFFKGEVEKLKATKEYNSITKPRRMQYARYRDRLNEIFATLFDKARTHLERVMKQFPSTEAKKTLEKIELIEKEIKG